MADEAEQVCVLLNKIINRSLTNVNAMYLFHNYVDLPVLSYLIKMHNYLHVFDVGW